MAEIAHPVDLNLSEQLQDRNFRKAFFLAEASARIAAQLIALRKKRGLNQQQVAEMIGTRQPAISRAEKADYHNWSFNTLRSIADALDARIRVYIEPSEDVLDEYAPAHVSESAPQIPAIEDVATTANRIPLVSTGSELLVLSELQLSIFDGAEAAKLSAALTRTTPDVFANVPSASMVALNV